MERGERTMAARHTSARTNHTGNARQRQMYVYGNTAPKPEYEPRRQHVSKPQKKVSHQVKKNRRKALQVNQSYVVFLSIAAIFALILCVNYVQLQSRLTSHSKNITALQEELTNLKEENNTKYNAVMDSVNLEEIREKAETELGMVYASPDQVVEYQSPSSDYVKQYEDIPEDGVLAQSDKK